MPTLHPQTDLNSLDYFQCEIEQAMYEAGTGQKLSKPRIQHFESKNFENTLTNLRRIGYTVTVIHDPEAYRAELEAEKASKPKTSKDTTKNLLA